MVTKTAKNSSGAYREAADKIWDLAKEYKAKGLHDLSEMLIDIAAEVHNLARAKEYSEMHKDK